LTYLRSQSPDWPEYVVADMLYKSLRNETIWAELLSYLQFFKKDFAGYRWQQQKLFITISIFDPDTQRRMQERGMGSRNPYGVPGDEQRHQQQQQMIQQKGVSQEPIIVRKTAGGYELLGGWHRTMQHLQAYPQGYYGPAWVATR
jgi:hypothetical protein